MFVTPLFEVKTPEKDRFVSLSYDANSNPTEYKYLDSTQTIQSVKMPLKAFERLTLATYADGTILYVDTKGKIGTERTPQGL